MDLKKVNDLSSQLVKTNVGPAGTGSPSGASVNPGKTQVGPSFEETLAKLKQPGVMPTVDPKIPKMGLGSTEGIKFSNHAVERMRTRGVSFSPADLERLSQAVEKAAAKGSKDSLVLMNDNALIVSVKNKTVVTVVDKSSLKENVFTNIDSTVVL